jgi:hypothetical protein
MPQYSRFSGPYERQLTNFGETVTIRSQTITYDEDDDPTYSNTDTTATAIVHIVSVQDALESAGTIRAGSALIYLKASTSISRGDLISHQSVWYEVKGIQPVYVVGTKVAQECTCSPLETNSPKS